MSSGGGRKRGHGAVSDGTDASVSRLTKQLKPPPAPPSAEPRPPGFLDLPSGIVANIAQFIYIGAEDDEGRLVGDGKILMYLCLVFGRQTARVIRREYLSNNLLYLDYLYFEAKSYSEDIVSMKKERRVKFITTLNGALKQWMEENEWWKDACRDAAVFAKGCDVCTKYPPIYKTSETKIASDEDRNQWIEALGINEANLIDLYFEEGPLGDDYTTVLAVDDIDLKNYTKEMTWEQAREAIFKEGDKKLRVMHDVFASIFLNPALAVDLGMLELFRFQAEDLMLDVNCQDYTGLFFNGVNNDDEEFQAGQPLLLHALINPDKRFFECLLSVADFDANPVIERDLKDGRDIGRLRATFLHRLPHILRCDLPNNINICWVAHMIKVKEIDLGVQNAEGMSPLERLCYLRSLTFGAFVLPSQSITKHDYDIAKMFLSAGAEVTQRALQYVRLSDPKKEELLELLQSYTRNSSEPEHPMEEI